MTNLACAHPESSADMQAWLAELVAKEKPGLAMPIDAGTTFMDLGLDSMSAVTLVGTIEMALNIELPPTLIWDHPDVGALAEFLMTQLRTSASA